jgi:MarR family 2-MHQ and catechol resistance regulon transcriptional repressor
MGTHYHGSRGEVRALDAYIKLARAADSVMSRTSQRLAATGLTVSQFGALESLYHLGPLCQRELGEKLLKTSGNIVMVVDNLEKRGLVSRHRGKDDRRFVSVRLTGKGRRLIAHAFPQQLKAIVEDMSALSGPELEELGVLCRRLGRREPK